jgi:hypothetical protein
VKLFGRRELVLGMQKNVFIRKVEQDRGAPFELPPQKRILCIHTYIPIRREKNRN